MLVFVDESGDSGMKFGEGSSEFFTVTAVLFQDRDDAAACDEAFSEIRTKCRLAQHREFHFNGHSDWIRKQFLREIVRFDFFYLSVVLNKPELTGPGFKFKDSLVKFTSKLVFQNAKPYIENATVVVDGSSTKEFRSQMSAYLKRQINEPSGTRHIAKVKMQDSRKNNLIQLADMVCGAVHQSVARGNSEYRRIIKARELRVQTWPQK